MSFDLKSLTVQKMLFQRVIPRLEGGRLGDKEYLKDILKLVDAGVGGFILFGGDFWEVRQALPKLQAKADVPLLFMSDMEKGAGQQLKGATVFPCQMAVAAAADLVTGEGLTVLAAMLDGMAYEARAAGVQAILTPVLDVNSNPLNPIISTRAFSDEPHVVSGLGERYVKGLQGSPVPVMACGKHFPGHGDSQVDSHTALPTLDKDRESLEEEDMLPFRRAVMAGVEMIMMAHIKAVELDPVYPASLSQTVIRRYLRNRAGFDGLVLTDALNMGALAQSYSPKEAARLAIKAGVDILLHPGEPLEFLNVLNELIREKGVTKEEIFMSAARLAKAKMRYCQTPRLPDRQVAGRIEENSAVADELASRALTLVKAAGAFPKLREIKGNIAHIVLEDDGDPKAGRSLRSALARQKNVKNLFVTKPKLEELKAEAV
ncbi:MAG: glycoside hydrolase family 3 protein, partial [Nitrospirota bacterium]